MPGDDESRGAALEVWSAWLAVARAADRLQPTPRSFCAEVARALDQRGAPLRP